MKTAVDLKYAYHLINHGPTVLVSAAHAGRDNVMAAAWNCAIDFAPVPKLMVIVDKSTFTRGMIEASGEFVVNVPTVAQAALTTAIGSRSGRETDKLGPLSIETMAASKVAAPLVGGCVAWLECKLIHEPELARKYDMLLGEIVAAWADDRVWRGNRWHFDDPACKDLRTIHHIAAGIYFTLGEKVVT